MDKTSGIRASVRGTTSALWRDASAASRRWPGAVGLSLMAVSAGSVALALDRIVQALAP